MYISSVAKQGMNFALYFGTSRIHIQEAKTLDKLSPKSNSVHWQ